MTTKLLIATLAGLSFTGCTNPINSIIPSSIHTPPAKKTYQKPTMAEQEAFRNTRTKVASGIMHDSKYKKIAYKSSEDKLWFNDLMYRLWDRQITRDQFISEGIAKYPAYKYNFIFVANGFQKHS
jgi:hypothetical protein